MTWRVQDVAVRRATLDFSSSGQGQYDAKQVVLDGELFANAAGLTSWDDDRIQALVCESCGVEHCEPGGWLTLRAAGDVRLFIPLFAEWDSTGNSQENAPPPVVASRGAPLFEPAVYSHLRDILPGLPADPPSITAVEARQLLLFELPKAVRINSRWDLGHSVLAVDGTATESAVDALWQVLADLEGCTDALHARPLDPTDRAVTFHVNDARMTEWAPIAMTQSGPRVLWGRWVATPDGEIRHG